MDHEINFNFQVANTGVVGHDFPQDRNSFALNAVFASFLDGVGGKGESLGLVSVADAVPADEH